MNSATNCAGGGKRNTGIEVINKALSQSPSFRHIFCFCFKKLFLCSSSFDTKSACTKNNIPKPHFILSKPHCYTIKTIDMKKCYFFFAVLFGLFSLNLIAQVPQGANYQAVARDAEGKVMADRDVSVRLSIINVNFVVYMERHKVRTNHFGLFTVTLGMGGSSLFGNINTIN